MSKQIAQLPILKFSNLETPRMNIPLLIVYRVPEDNPLPKHLWYGLGAFLGYNEFNRPLWQINNMERKFIDTLTIVGYAYLPETL